MELVTGVRSSVYTTPAPGNTEKAESQTGLRLLSFSGPESQFYKRIFPSGTIRPIGLWLTTDPAGSRFLMKQGVYRGQETEFPACVRQP